MKTRNRIAAFALMAASFLGFCVSAGATVMSYNLDTDDGSVLGNITGQYGVVTLTSSGTSILVDVLLATNYTFAVTGSKNPFAYSSSGGAATSILFKVPPSGTLPGSALAGVEKQVPFGQYTDAITMDKNGTTIYNELTFTLLNTSFSNFSVSTANSGHDGGYLFSADVSHNVNGGSTFAVATTDTSIPSNGRVPEPATLALLGLGLLGFAVSRRRQQS